MCRVYVTQQHVVYIRYLYAYEQCCTRWSFLVVVVVVLSLRSRILLTDLRTDRRAVIILFSRSLLQRGGIVIAHAGPRSWFEYVNRPAGSRSRGVYNTIVSLHKERRVQPPPPPPPQPPWTASVPGVAAAVPSDRTRAS